MERATPIQMRKSLEIVELFKRAGIRFIPMPIFDDDDLNIRVAEMTGKLEEIERRANLVEMMKPIVPSNA